VLLTMGDGLGTLAAARELGRLGIPVVLADRRSRTVTARSCYVARRVPCPGLDRPGDWLQWLLDFGRREPGHVLLATSDDVCWMLDTHRHALERWFHLYQPAQGRAWSLLDKRSLHRLCAQQGIDQPLQWTAAQAQAVADLPYPLVVKARTQAGVRRKVEGTVVRDAASLQAALAAWPGRATWRPEMLLHEPDVDQPLVQAYHDEPGQQVYTLAGFYAPEADTFLLRAAAKVLNDPAGTGVGLCLESRPVQPALARQLRALMDSAGYRGAFEVEYIHLPASGRYLLLDFSPRLYGRMAFEISRGLPVPQLCQLAACGQWDEVRQLALQSRLAAAGSDGSGEGWIRRLSATTQLLGGRLGLGPWRFWGHRAPGATADAVVPGHVAASGGTDRQDAPVPPQAALRRLFAPNARG
jgi:predicted ATP-grasp superfamily ATP-dependent carboligase